MGKKVNTTEEIEEALRKHRGMTTYAAKELGCHYETVKNRIEGSEKLQKVMVEIREEKGDDIENVLAINLALASRKAKKMNKILEDTDDKDIMRIGIDKDSCEVAMKVGKMQHQARGFVEKVEVKNEVIVEAFNITFRDGTDESNAPS